MKNLFTYLSISIFAVSLVACSEDVQEPTTTVGEPIEISLNASVGEFTRASYTEGDSDYAFSWSYNDELCVYNYASTSLWGSTFTTTTTSNSSSATFTGTIDSWSGTTDLYAVYEPTFPHFETSTTGINGATVDTSDATVTYKFGGNYVTPSTSSTTNINNMGLLVGVVEDATTTNIPDATLNQAMSFLQITFEGISTESLGSIELSTSSGEALFVTSAKIEIATGEINEVLTTSSTLNSSGYDIDATNNIWTIPLLPTDMTSTIILSCDLGDYKFSASECSGFFERNSVYSGSINVSEFTEVEEDYTCYLEDMNLDTFDLSRQVQNIDVRCYNIDQLSYGDFGGLRTFLQNQNRKTVCLELRGLNSDIPDGALAGIDTFNSLELYFTVAGAKIGDSAFKGCSSLVSVNLDLYYFYYSNEIGDSSFEDCVNLQSIDGLNNSTSVGDSAFKNCENFSSNLSLNEITYIGDYAFYNCNNIEYIEIGEESSDVELTYLGTGAFSNDSGSYTEDKDLYIYDSNVEYLTGDKTFDVSGQSYTFSTIYLNGAVYVHNSGSSSDDPAMSVINANKVSWCDLY